MTTTTTDDDAPLPPFAPPPLQSIENTTTNNNTTNSDAKNAYEIERDLKVSMNLARLKALGIDVAREKMDLENAKKTKTKKHNNASKKRTALFSSSEPRVTRRQRMMQNETSEERAQREAAEKVQRDELFDGDGKRKRASKTTHTKSRGMEFPNVREEFPNSLGMFGPFAMKTPKTNGPVTVVEVGEVVSGGRRRFASEFWSRSGCLYHHPYLIGYKAEKVFQGRVYLMEIVDGDDRPMFRVTDKEAPGKTFVGETPTAPWYDLLISKRLGTRISGPQFFGFSERTTMAAIGFQLEKSGEKEMLKQCYSKGYAMDDGEVEEEEENRERERKHEE